MLKLTRWKSRTRAGWGIGSTAGLAAVSLIDLAGWWRVGEVIVVALLALFVGLLARAERRATEQELTDARDAAVDAREDADIAMTDSLLPLVDTLGELCAKTRQTEKTSLARQLVTAAVQILSKTMGNERSRSCFFTLSIERGKRILRSAPGGYAGRGEAPSTVFVEGTERGDSAIAMIESPEGKLYVYDVLDQPPPGWVGPRAYRTFIAVGVKAGGRTFGMLTVDALQPGELTESTDLASARVIAGMLAVAFVAAGGKVVASTRG